VRFESLLADRYTHDFFFERDYPEVTVLEEIFGRLRAEPQQKRRCSNNSGSMRMCLTGRSRSCGPTAALSWTSPVSKPGHDQWRKPYNAPG